MSSGSVRIWWDDSVKAYRMATPYNKAFLDLLKQLVPVSDRSYDDASRTWTFTERFLNPVKTIAEKSFGCQATVITKDQSQRAQMPKATAIAPIDSVWLDFVKVLPYEAAQKAYRHAAMMLHPDRGGDMATMSKLNAAWTRLETEFYKKGTT